MRQNVATAERLLEDPTVPNDDKARIRRAIAAARGALSRYDELRSQGQTRTATLASIGGAAGLIVADDATVVGVADDPLLIVLGLAAIGTYIFTSSSASRDALNQAWQATGQQLSNLARIIGATVLMTAAGNVVHDHIVDEARKLAVALGLAATVGQVTREMICQMLERMARQTRRADKEKWKKIVSTQKGLKCRSSRASR
jgi:hypothetical protein